MVAHGYHRGIIKIHIAEDTAHAKHVLTFQIRAVAPAEHLHRQPVSPFLQIGSQIKFRHIVRTLRIAYVPAVQVYQSCAINATEMNESTFILPSLRQIEEADIRTYRIYAVILSPVTLA